jgi:hypothetical protein
VPVPFFGSASFWKGAVFCVERLCWRGRPLPFGVLRLRWLLPASRVGYPYPGRTEPDVIDRPAPEVDPGKNAA